jgi:beta-glucosidase
MNGQNNQFPKDFLWGTATAAHQVEGNNRHSDWWNWEVNNDNIPNSDIACDHYNLFKKDFDLIKDVLHNNAHRLSIEWARIEPSEGILDEKAISHYKEVFSELKKRGIKIMLTLDHFTHPLWFMKKGGWERRENIKYFKRFADLVIKEYRDDIDYWCIINEANVYSACSYIKGFWTPQKKNFFTALKVYRNLARAHKIIYKLIHKEIPNSIVGSAINMTYFKGSNFFERILARIGEFIVNDSFIYLSKYHDFIGINSYFFKPAKFSDLPLIKRFKRKQARSIVEGQKSDLGWVIYPQGIYHSCIKTWKKFGKPIIITENGIADRNDSLRPKYLLDNLNWVLAAIKEGADVRGYFHWSLMDNVEWTFGKHIRFGLFETDYETMKRIPRKSALLYGYICQNNSLDIPKDILK